MVQSQSGQWTSECVKDLHPTKHSYVIQSKGRCYRRNRKFLRPTRVRSNSVRDDVPAYTDVTLRSKTPQRTNDISTTSDVQPNAVPETTTSRVEPPAEKPVRVTRSDCCVKLPARYND